MANKKISQVLIESQETRKQTYGSLFDNEDEIKQITKYCAMGALMCESGLLENKEGSNSKWIHQPSDRELFEHFMGVGSYKDEGKKECRICESGEHKLIGESIYSKENPYSWYWLSSIIIHMNDAHHMTFEQIGKEVERLGF